MLGSTAGRYFGFKTVSYKFTGSFTTLFWIAHITSSALLWIPSFRMRLNLWASTVFTLSPSMLAADRTVALPPTISALAAREPSKRAAEAVHLLRAIPLDVVVSIHDEAGRPLLRHVSPSPPTLPPKSGCSCGLTASDAVHPSSLRSNRQSKTIPCSSEIPASRSVRTARITFKNMDIRDHHLGSMLKRLSQSFGSIIGLRDDLDIPFVFQ